MDLIIWALSSLNSKGMDMWENKDMTWDREQMTGVLGLMIHGEEVTPWIEPITWCRDADVCMGEGKKRLLPELCGMLHPCFSL